MITRGPRASSETSDWPGDTRVSRVVRPTPVMLLLVLTGTAAAGDGARDLFDGKDLEGWQQVGPGSFVIEHGLLKSVGGMGLLWYTREQFANATLRVVFKLSGKAPDQSLAVSEVVARGAAIHAAIMAAGLGRGYHDCATQPQCAEPGEFRSDRIDRRSRGH